MPGGGGSRTRLKISSSYGYISCPVDTYSAPEPHLYCMESHCMLHGVNFEVIGWTSKRRGEVPQKVPHESGANGGRKRASLQWAGQDTRHWFSSLGRPCAARWEYIGRR